MDLGDLLSWCCWHMNILGVNKFMHNLNNLKIFQRHPHGEQYSLTLEYSFAFLISFERKKNHSCCTTETASGRNRTNCEDV